MGLLFNVCSSSFAKKQNLEIGCIRTCISVKLLSCICRENKDEGQLRILAALPEDLNLLPSTYVVTHNCLLLPAPGI